MSSVRIFSQLDSGDTVGFYVILMPEHKLTAFLPEGVTGIYKMDKEAMFQADWILQQSVFVQNSEPIPDNYTLTYTFYGSNEAPLFYLYKK